MYDKVDAKTEEAEGVDPLQKIIALQTFEGYWTLDVRLLEVVGLSAQHDPLRTLIRRCGPLCWRLCSWRERW